MRCKSLILVIALVSLIFLITGCAETGFVVKPELAGQAIYHDNFQEYYIVTENGDKETIFIQKGNLPFIVDNIKANQNGTLALVVYSFLGEPLVGHTVLTDSPKTDAKIVYYLVFVSNKNQIKVKKCTNNIKEIEWLDTKTLKVSLYGNQKECVKYIKSPF